MKNEMNVELFSGVGCGKRFMRCYQKLSLQPTDDISGETPLPRRFIFLF